jgi:hypothetical protein
VHLGGAVVRPCRPLVRVLCLPVTARVGVAHG